MACAGGLSRCAAALLSVCERAVGQPAAAVDTPLRAVPVRATQLEASWSLLHPPLRDVSRAHLHPPSGVMSRSPLRPPFGVLRDLERAGPLLAAVAPPPQGRSPARLRAKALACPERQSSTAAFLMPRLLSLGRAFRRRKRACLPAGPALGSLPGSRAAQRGAPRPGPLWSPRRLCLGTSAVAWRWTALGLSTATRQARAAWTIPGPLRTTPNGRRSPSMSPLFSAS